MGTRAGEYTNNILGSTAQKVVTDAPVPVMTVNVASE
jgi:nucleotide-binding universal stress UspA family protein